MTTSFFDTRDLDRTAPAERDEPATFPGPAVAVVHGMVNAGLPVGEIVRTMNASNSLRKLDGSPYLARDIEVLTGIPSTRPAELEERAS